MLKSQNNVEQIIIKLVVHIITVIRNKKYNFQTSAWEKEKTMNL